MSGQFPQLPRPNVCSITALDPCLLDRAHSGRRQVRLLGAHRWRIELEWPPKLRPDAETLFAFVARQRGRSQIFTFIPPASHGGQARGTGLGAPFARARANLLAYSDDFSQTAWTKFQCAQGTPAAGASPDDTDMQEWHRTATTFSASVSQAVSTMAAKQVLSVYVLAGTSTLSRLDLHDGTALVHHSIDLVWTGGVPSIASPTAVDASGLEAVGGGVYRAWLAVDGQARGIVGNARQVWLMPSVNADLAGVYLWRAQLEEGYLHPGYRLQTTIAGQATEEQAGVTLYTDGWTANQPGALLPGDYLLIAGDAKVYKAAAAAAADANGVAAISIVPDLRQAPANGSLLTFDDVPFTVSLESDSQQLSGYQPNRFGFACSLIEEL